MLTALIDRPDRLIHLSSGLHHAGAGSLRDIDWTGRQWNAVQAYAESKLQVTALAFTVARAWPDVLSNAVDPGWVPTKMGGSRSDRRPGAGIPHADMARRQQRRSRNRERRLLVPPAAAGARTTNPRPGFPGPTDGPAGRAHRCHSLLAPQLRPARSEESPGPGPQAKEPRGSDVTLAAQVADHIGGWARVLPGEASSLTVTDPASPAWLPWDDSWDEHRPHLRAMCAF
jgi:hypothetical protein